MKLHEYKRGVLYARVPPKNASKLLIAQIPDDFGNLPLFVDFHGHNVQFYVIRVPIATDGSIPNCFMPCSKFHAAWNYEVMVVHGEGMDSMDLKSLFTSGIKKLRVQRGWGTESGDTSRSQQTHASMAGFSPAILTKGRGGIKS